MRRLILLMGCLLCALSAFAQDPQTGVPPFSSVQSLGLDAINRQNLNVNFSIPVASSPGRGINFSFPIVNDSLLWMKKNNAWTPVVDGSGNPTWGWKTTLPAGAIRYVRFTETCDSPPPIQSSPHYHNYSYTDPAGTTHNFDVDFYQFATVCGFPTGPRTGYANDDSGYYLDASSLSAPKTTTPAGQVITGTNWTDTNGNYVSATVVNSSETDWKDSAGHTPLKIITVTAPQLSYDSAANQYVYTFNSSGQEITEKFYQGSTGGTLLRTVNTTWVNGAPATQITVLEDNSTQNEVETVYDSFGNLQVMFEHDWGTGTPGNILRRTNITYLSTSPYIAANILNRPTLITTADGAGTIKSRTLIAYDESGFINSPCITGAVQHNDSAYGCSFTTRGNPTTSTTYTDPVTPGGAIAKHQYYDSLGNLVKADANCCQQVQWNYSVTTNYTFPDSVLRGVGTGPQLTRSVIYNSYTGFAAAFTDENAKTTTYAYTDPGHLNRITSITRPDNAQITYSYDDVNSTIQVSSPIVGSSVAVRKSYFDGLGRAVKQQLLDGSSTSYSIVETQYDA